MPYREQILSSDIMDVKIHRESLVGKIKERIDKIVSEGKSEGIEIKEDLALLNLQDINEEWSWKLRERYLEVKNVFLSEGQYKTISEELDKVEGAKTRMFKDDKEIELIHEKKKIHDHYSCEFDKKINSLFVFLQSISLDYSDRADKWREKIIEESRKIESICSRLACISINYAELTLAPTVCQEKRYNVSVTDRIVLMTSYSEHWRIKKGKIKEGELQQLNEEINSKLDNDVVIRIAKTLCESEETHEVLDLKEKLLDKCKDNIDVLCILL